MADLAMIAIVNLLSRLFTYALLLPQAMIGVDTIVSVCVSIQPVKLARGTVNIIA
jgi:hypothetical protein